MSAALERASSLMETLGESVEGWGGPAMVAAAGVLAQIALAESLQEVARQLERMQRLGFPTGRS